ncbi:MAG: hypothetical protein ACYC5U_02335 [Rhodocyclaceae bacterium]
MSFWEQAVEPTPLTEVTHEEIAEMLSLQEGRPVSVQEVRRIEGMALMKLRRLMRERGLTGGNLLPE